MHLSWNNKKDVARFIRILQEGMVIVGSSDTVLGLYADSTYQGFCALNALKARGEKPYLLLIESKKKAECFIDSSYLLQMEKIIDACWPGPLTVIFPAKATTPSYIMGKDCTVAVRVPAHQELLNVLKNFNGLFSTSANISGCPVPGSMAELDPELAQKIEYSIISTHEVKTTTPSTIIQWMPAGFTMIREGAYSQHFLNQFIPATGKH